MKDIRAHIDRQFQKIVDEWFAARFLATHKRQARDAASRLTQLQLFGVPLWPNIFESRETIVRSVKSIRDLCSADQWRELEGELAALDQRIANVFRPLE